MSSINPNQLNTMAQEIANLLDAKESSETTKGDSQIEASIWNKFVGPDENGKNQVGNGEKSKIKTKIPFQNAISSIASYIKNKGTAVIQKALKRIGIEWKPSVEVEANSNVSQEQSTNNVDAKTKAAAKKKLKAMQAEKASNTYNTNDTYPVSTIIDDLYNDIYAKKRFGTPTTGKNIKEHVKRINKDNILEVVSGYYAKTGKDKQSLVSAIFHEVGLSADDRAEMVLYIENCLLDKHESKGVYVKDLREIIKKEIQYQKDKIGVMSGELLDKLNDKLNDRLKGKLMGQNMKDADGSINEVSYQGLTSDCWLLASINSIVKSPKGKQILNNSIKVNNDGSVTVHLKGVNKTYTFSRVELYGSTELATGDMDVRALEKAVERYMIEEKHDDINGDRRITAYKILLGESHLDLGGWDEIWDIVVGISDSYRKKIQDPNTICTAAVHDTLGKKQDSDIVCTTSGGTQIYKNHAYSVVRADDKYVYLINPWNSGNEIRMTFEEFKNTFNSFTDVTL